MSKVKKQWLHCDQCEMLSINGIPCHEIGCPNAKKMWDPEQEEWVTLVECSRCGEEYYLECGHECADD